MRKIFCDGCGVEISKPVSFSVPCHLWSFRGRMGYVDGDGNQVSDRSDVLELCAKCSNAVYSAAVEELTKIQAQRT